MRLDGNELHSSATDLANHLGCRHLTNLDSAISVFVLQRCYHGTDFFFLGTVAVAEGVPVGAVAVDQRAGARVGLAVVGMR